MGWQEVVVFVLVAGAAAWLVVSRVRRRARHRCDDCALVDAARQDSSQPRND